MASESPNLTSSAETTTVFNSNNPSSTLLSINMSNVTKLSNLNYIMWSRQIRAILEGHELHGFIDDSTEIPSPTITVGGQTTPNTAFAPWRRQDRLLYSAIIGAISLSIQPVVSSATTTCDVWNILLATYGNPTRGHIRQLKYQIKTCVKGTKTITEYLRLIKAKSDELALLGKPLDPVQNKFLLVWVKTTNQKSMRWMVEIHQSLTPNCMNVFSIEKPWFSAPNHLLFQLFPSQQMP